MPHGSFRVGIFNWCYLSSTARELRRRGIHLEYPLNNCCHWYIYYKVLYCVPVLLHFVASRYRLSCRYLYRRTGTTVQQPAPSYRTTAQHYSGVKHLNLGLSPLCNLSLCFQVLTGERPWYQESPPFLPRSPIWITTASAQVRGCLGLFKSGAV